MSTENPPAFPRPASPAEFVDHCQDGMLLRDFFAAKAPEIDSDASPKYIAEALGIEVCAAPTSDMRAWFLWWRKVVALWSYAHADAMLKARTEDRK